METASAVNRPAEPVVFFADGVVVSESTMAFAAGFVDAPDAATSRVLWLFEDGWAADDVEQDFIVSLTYSAQRNQVFALGRNGWVRSSGGNGKNFDFDSICGEYTEVQIAGASDRGVMSRVRAIGGGVYACGWGSQVYKLAGTEWRPFEHGLDPSVRYGFLDINGPAEDDIHAIGMDGVIAHFDGTRWSVVDSITNLNLLSTACLANGEIVIVGADGTILQGHKDSWSNLSHPAVTGNLWDVEAYEGRLFLVATSSPTGLFEQSHNGWVPVQHGSPTKPTTHRLCSGSGQLWSIGEYDLLKYDGVAWTVISCPENEP